jgi:hypothetical protein
MKDWLRFRHWFMIGGSLVIVIYLYISDPNNGDLTLPFLAKLATPIIAVWFAHLARKALFDYIDLFSIIKKAKETATGAGLVFVGICIVIFGLLGLFGSQVYAQDVKTYIPVQAQTYLPTVVSEKTLYWVDHPKQEPLEL